MSVSMHVPVIVTDGGPWASHDVACPVCSKRKAIIILETGVFVPCSECLHEGWELVRWRTRWGRWRAKQRAMRSEIYRTPRPRKGGQL